MGGTVQAAASQSGVATTASPGQGVQTVVAATIYLTAALGATVQTRVVVEIQLRHKQPHELSGHAPALPCVPRAGYRVIAERADPGKIARRRLRERIRRYRSSSQPIVNAVYPTKLPN